MDRADLESVIEVNVTNVDDLHEKINDAVAQTRGLATGLGHGIMVTQHDFGSFSVAVSPDVPPGQTMERRGW